jgi:hypothetical protein
MRNSGDNFCILGQTLIHGLTCSKINYIVFGRCSLHFSHHCSQVKSHELELLRLSRCHSLVIAGQNPCSEHNAVSFHPRTKFWISVGLYSLWCVTPVDISVETTPFSPPFQWIVNSKTARQYLEASCVSQPSPSLESSGRRAISSCKSRSWFTNW